MRKIPLTVTSRTSTVHLTFSDQVPDDWHQWPTGGKSESRNRVIEHLAQRADEPSCRYGFSAVIMVGGDAPITLSFDEIMDLIADYELAADEAEDD